MIRVTRDDFNVDEELRRLAKPSVGGLVTFVGAVRDESEAGRVERMEIEVYPEMAEKQLEAIRREAIKKFGVEDIIIDPGFGFGKNLDHNYELLNRLDAFKVFQLPVMVGLSRKSMIWKALDITPETALNGTTVANTLALMGGADILRVHDVKEAVEAIKIFCEIKATIKK